MSSTDLQMYNNGTITICGVVLVIPNSENTRGFDYREFKEGKITTKELWLNSYRKDGNAEVCWSYKISTTNRGKCLFEDKSVKTDDAEKIRYVFDNFKK